jgi:hypothetical protein
MNTGQNIAFGPPGIVTDLKSIEIEDVGRSPAGSHPARIS